MTLFEFFLIGILYVAYGRGLAICCVDLWMAKFKVSAEFLRLKEQIHGASRELSLAVVIPFRNEERTIGQVLKAVLKSSYPVEAVYLIDDGSTDRGPENISRDYALLQQRGGEFLGSSAHKELRVHKGRLGNTDITLVQKQGGGKSEALEMALRSCKQDVLCCIDGDSIPCKGGVEALLAPLNEDKDIAISNGLAVPFFFKKSSGSNPSVEQRMLLEFIRVECLVDAFGRLAENVASCHMTLTGCFAAYRVESIKKIGGFLGRSILEDNDIAIDLELNGRGSEKKSPVVYSVHALAKTLVSPSFRGWFSQRKRWAGGFWVNLQKYDRVLFDPNFEWMGLWYFPVRYASVVLAPIDLVASPLFWPLYVYLGASNPLFLSACLKAFAFVVVPYIAFKIFVIPMNAYKATRAIPFLRLSSTGTSLKYLGILPLYWLYRSLTIFPEISGFAGAALGRLHWGDPKA